MSWSARVKDTSMNAIRNVTVPDIGDFKDVPIVEILVKPGDLVTKDAPLVMLESDKATLDVPSPGNGIVKELKVALGTRVSKGSLLLTLDEASGEGGAASQGPAAASAAVSRKATDAPENAAALEPETVTAFAPAVSRTIQSKAVSETIASQVVNSRPLAVHRTAHGSPSIRRMAREFGIDLSSVAGTGPRGRIVRQDLQQFVKRSFEVPATPAGGDNLGGLKIASWPKIDFATFGRIERAPLSKIRRISGGNLARNARGRKGGRPRKLSPKDLKTVRAMLKSGEIPVSTVAEKFQWRVRRSTEMLASPPR